MMMTAEIRTGAKRPARRAFVLPAVIFALVVMGVMSMAVLRASDDQSRSTQAFRQSAPALIAAEAGLRSTLGTWPKALLDSLAKGDSVASGWIALLPGKSAYRRVIHRIDASGAVAYLIVVQGRGLLDDPRGGQRTIEAVVRGVPTFGFGAFTSGLLKVTGGGSNIVVDSYNSEGGDVGTGSIASGTNISLTGTVTGDATAGGSNSGGVVQGTRTASATGLPSYSSPSCPTTGYTPAVNLAATGGMSYNASTGVLSVSGGNNVTLSGLATYYFSSVTLSGGSTLTLAPGSTKTTIYVAGDVTISGGGIVNTGHAPTMLTLSSCGSATSDWDLTGSSDAYMGIFAPNRNITISGGGDLYGALIGKTLDQSGGSQIHYDSALGSGRDNLQLLAGSWAELTAY